MRRALLAVLVVLATPASAQAAFGDVVKATSGLAAYWPLDDSTAPMAAAAGGFALRSVTTGFTLGSPAGIDAGGTSLSLTGATFTNPSGSSSAALNFAGDRTVEAWVAPTAFDGDRSVVSRGNSTGYHLLLSSGRPAFRVNGTTVRAASSLAAGRWYHVAGTLSGTTLTLYVNGAQVATATMPAATSTSSSTFYVGRPSNSTSTSARYRGGLDELALYGRALTTAEVAAHFVAGVDPGAWSTTLTARPAAVSDTPDGTVAFTSTKGGVTFTCALDDATTPAPCAGTFAYDLLRDGDHTLTINATDRWGITQTTSVAWRVALAANELAAPVTTFASAPPALTNATSASFSFSGSKTLLTFACRLDGGAWAACPGTAAYHQLKEGAHVLEVRATDRWGVVEAAPVSFRWTIDTTAPQSFVLLAKARAGDAGSAVLGSEAGATFECRSAQGGWAACPASFALPSLPEPGQLHVRAVDPAGNADPSPAIVVVEPAPANASIVFSGAGASFDVGGEADIAALRCSLDGAAPVACPWPLVFTALGYGDHTLTVTDPNLPGVVFPTLAWTNPLPAPQIVGSQFPAVLQLGSRRKQATLATSRLPRILFQSNSAGAAKVQLRRGTKPMRGWKAPVVQGSNLVRLPRAAWRRLRPGRYRLVVVVTNAAGASKPLTLRFDAVRTTRR